MLKPKNHKTIKTKQKIILKTIGFSTPDLNRSLLMRHQIP